MNKSMLELIESALAYIESRLTSKVTLEEIADSVHMSKYHAHRLISHAVGQPLMNYIRARKLTASIELLLAEQHYNIIEISRCFAFEHEQSYIRAFKKQYGLTPTRFRTLLPDLPLTEKADLSHLKELPERLLFKPAIIFRPAMQMVGLRHQIDRETNLTQFTANAAGNEFASPHKTSIPRRIHDQVYIGLTRYVSWDEESLSTYIPSVQVSSFEDMPPGLEANALPGGKYAIFRYVGEFHPRELTARHLKQISDYISDYVRLHKPSFYQSHPFHFEYIDERLANDLCCEVDIYFPVKSGLPGGIGGEE